MSKVCYEKVIAALILHGTEKEAAEAAGITQGKMRELMKERSFISDYTAAKNDIVRKAVLTMNEKASDAVNVVAEIMNDQSNPAPLRLSAAQTIINNAGKFADRLSKEEERRAAQARSPYDIDL